MQFNNFLRQVESVVSGSEIASSVYCCNHLVQETVDGKILLDRSSTGFGSLEEAKDFIKQRKLREELEQEIQQEEYSDISDNKIVNIIKQYHGNIRVTDTLIESYVELASSKLFTADPVVLDIRSLNKLDRLFENRIDFQLNDGTTMVITEETQQKINKIFAQHADVVDYMKSTKENFLSVLNQLED